MKKPEPKIDMNYEEDFDYITGWNGALEISEKYHNWDIKENYIKKPSVEEIEKTISEWILKHSDCSGVISDRIPVSGLAKTIIKEIKGE